MTTTVTSQPPAYHSWQLPKAVKLKAPRATCLRCCCASVLLSLSPSSSSSQKYSISAFIPRVLSSLLLLVGYFSSFLHFGGSNIFFLFSSSPRSLFASGIFRLLFFYYISFSSFVALIFFLLSYFSVLFLFYLLVDYFLFSNSSSPLSSLFACRCSFSSILFSLRSFPFHLFTVFSLQSDAIYSIVSLHCKLIQ